VVRTTYSNQRFVITKRGKKIAALVPVEDINSIQAGEQKKGLLYVREKWSDFEEISKDTEAVYNQRKEDRMRDVSF